MKLNDYIANRRKRDRKFDEGYEEGRAVFMIGQAAYLARKDAGLSQKDLAAKANVSVWTVSKLEKKPEFVSLGAASTVLSFLRPWLSQYGVLADHPIFALQVEDPGSPQPRRPARRASSPCVLDR